MASKPSTILTRRDLDTFRAISNTPLDARQLLEISVTFSQPFTHERLVRRRMQQLAHSAFVSCFQYATCTSGTLNYYKIAPLGYQILHGMKAELPHRRTFGPVSMALQQHTRALADFIVRTHAAAHCGHATLVGFWRENELRLSRQGQMMQPDCAFRLQGSDGRIYNYLVEIDCGSEPVRSSKHRESLEQKIRFYDGYQDGSTHRFRVLVLFTKSVSRLARFLETVSDTVTNQQRQTFYGATMADYLGARDPLCQPVFFDHHLRPRPLLRPSDQEAQPPPAGIRRQLVAEPAVVW